jgi:hypothetical protein
MRMVAIAMCLLAAVTARAEEFRDDKGFRLGLDAPGWVVCRAVPPPQRSDPGCGDPTALEKLGRANLAGRDAPELVALATVSRKETRTVVSVLRLSATDFDANDSEDVELLINSFGEGASSKGARLEQIDGQRWRRVKLGNTDAIRLVMGYDGEQLLDWVVPGEHGIYVISFSTRPEDRELVEPLAVNALRNVNVPPRQSGAFDTVYRVAMMIFRMFTLMGLIALVRWGVRRRATSRSR